MIYTTKAIVIQSSVYSESSIIVRAYTELLGMRSYIVKGVQSSKSKVKKNLLQSLNLLEIVAYENTKTNLFNIKELKNDLVYIGIPSHIHKTSIALFLSEVLSKVLKEQGQDPYLFSFLEKSLKHLDVTTSPVYNFQLIFMVELAKYLGFAPQNNYSSSNLYFSIKEGFFQNHYYKNSYYIDFEKSKYLSELFAITDYDISFQITNVIRRELLDILIEYYKVHLPIFHNIYSHTVLHDIFV